MIRVDADALGVAHGKRLGLSVGRGTKAALPARLPERPTMSRPGMLQTLHVDMS